MKKIVYIAGPYSGPTHDGRSYFSIDRNIMLARETAKQVWEMGAVALCPHLNTAHFELDTSLSAQDYYDGDLALLAKCDAILMMATWCFSKGSKIEREFAEKRKMPIFYHFENLKTWIDGFKADPVNPAAVGQSMPTGDGVFVTPLVIDDVARHRMIAKGHADSYYKLLQIAFFLKTQLIVSESGKPLSEFGIGEIRNAIIEDLEARSAEGEKKYGTRLRTNNGRDATMDQYQEILDALQYGRQDIREFTEVGSKVA